MKSLKICIVAVALLAVVSVMSFRVGFQAGKRDRNTKSSEILVRGCGIYTQIMVKADRPMTLHKLTKEIQPLPSVVNGALVKAPSGEYYCRLTEMVGTNGVGQLPLFGGEEILFVHRDD